MDSINPFLIILAAIPGLAISFYIYYKDQHEKEPSKHIIMCFIFGMLSTVPAIYMEQFGMSLGFDVSDSLVTTFIFAFGVVGFSEEFVKFAVLRGYIYPKKDFNEPMDGIVYAVMISMGFATLENFMYSSYGLKTTVVRAFTAVPAHAAFAVMMGYYVGLAKFAGKDKEILYLIMGFAGAVLLHGAYDFFIFQKMYPALGGLTIATLIIGIVLGRKMIQMHQDNSPFKDGQPEDDFMEDIDHLVEGYDKNDDYFS